MGDEEHGHEGTFAEGQERDEHQPEAERRGEFAEEHDDHQHEGTFGTGQEAGEQHPEGGRHGDFAEGQEKD
jgi:hypothetical protein